MCVLSHCPLNVDCAGLGFVGVSKAPSPSPELQSIRSICSVSALCSFALFPLCHAHKETLSPRLPCTSRPNNAMHKAKEQANLGGARAGPITLADGGVKQGDGLGCVFQIGM